MKRTPLTELSSQGFERFLQINLEWSKTFWFQLIKRYKLWKELKKLK